MYHLVVYWPIYAKIIILIVDPLKVPFRLTGHINIPKTPELINIHIRQIQISDSLLFSRQLNDIEKAYIHTIHMFI